MMKIVADARRYISASSVTALLATTLAGCVAGPEETGTASSETTLSSVSSEMASSSVQMSSSIAVSSSSFAVSSQSSQVSSEASSSVMVTPSSSTASSSSSEIASSSESSSEPSSSSSAEFSSSSLLSSSSSLEASSSSENSSSSQAPVDTVSCVFEANLNNGNSFQANPLKIVSTDSRAIASWTLTLSFSDGTLSDPQAQLYSAGKLLANVSKTNLVVSVQGVDGIPAMTTLDIPGVQFGTSGVKTIPECGLIVEFEGGSSNSSGGSNSNGSNSSGGSSSESSGGFTQEQLDEYFDQFSCGVGFTAMGNGGYKACYRLANGTAECISPGSTTPTQVSWQSGGAVTDVLHVSASGENEVSVVTTDGAVYTGPVGQINKPAVIADGGVAVTGGRNTKCALVKDGSGFDIACFGASASRPALPGDFEPVQVTSGYGGACALNSQGEIWCWDIGGNVPQFITSTPSKMAFSEPMLFASMGQDSVCGIKSSGGLDCLANWYANPYLPTIDDGGIFKLDPDAFLGAVSIQAAYAQGIVISADGTATYLPRSGNPPSPNPGKVFDKGSNYIAAGGDRGVKCALTESGDVYCLDSGDKAVKVNSSKAQAAECPY